MKKDLEKGFTTMFVALLILLTMLVIGIGVTNLILNQYKIIDNTRKGAQAYLAAESGIEDALLRLAKGMDFEPLAVLTVGSATTSTEISEMIGGARTVIAEGDFRNSFKKVRAVYSISADEASFYYGVQVGQGGLIMDNHCRVNGNVFSNGSIVAYNNSEITGSAKVALAGNEMDGVQVGIDAFTNTCRDSTITGTLTCVNNINCTASSYELLTEEIAQADMSISQEQIDEWKAVAEAGEIIIGDYEVPDKITDYLGPAKIEGNLIVDDKDLLYMTGTIWVTGNILMQNQGRILLDPEVYTSMSGVLVGDGIITLENSAKALGTGEQGSYFMILSTSSANPAITIRNSFETDILYTNNGWILVENTSDLREIVGYGVHLQNYAEIFYEAGLENSSFSSGPSGGWQVEFWKEVE